MVLKSRYLAFVSVVPLLITALVTWPTAVKATAAALPIVTSSCGATPASLSAGTNASFTAAITSSASLSNAIVSFEVYNATSHKVYQTYQSPLTFAANVLPKLVATWAIPSSQASGSYSIKVLVFGPNWSPLYSAHWDCASFAVTAAVPPAPSTQKLPVGDLPGWHQIFSDDFTTSVPAGSFPGSAYGRTWTTYPDGWKDSSGNGTYYPSKVLSVSNGILSMNIHTENGMHMVAAPEPILPGVPAGKGQLYGRYSIRFRSDVLAGYKTAWLLWPDSGAWPGDGEIDFPEGNLDGQMWAYVHHSGATVGSDQDAYPTYVTPAAWHIATLEWSPSGCTFILDGQIIATSTQRIPSTPMHWVLQTETAIDGTIPSNAAAGTVQIDWVAIYAPAGQA